jgi:hypothetical protein
VETNLNILPNLNPNFTLLKNTFYLHLCYGFKTSVLVDIFLKSDIVNDFEYHNKTFKTELKKWLLIMNIQDSMALIDILIEGNVKLPLWIYHKEFTIERNKNKVLDLIKEI